MVVRRPAEAISYGHNFQPHSLLKAAQFAKMIRVHPNTMFEWVTGQIIPWNRRVNPDFSFDQVATALACPVEALIKVAQGEDVILTRNEAMELVKANTETFRVRQYPILIYKTRAFRFSRSAVNLYHIRKFVK